MSSFDRAYALKKCQDITDDIARVDERLGDGIMVDSALNLLSGSYARLGNAGIPPGVSPAKYAARVQTLSEFTADAAAIIDVDPMEGTAKYEVARRETGVLFDMINGALGTNLALP
ncbi:MAG: hypothetical protein LWW86_04725 [Micrococcales bacterium]|nr:hypothetical protein [Micrococcales bacterium]